MHIKYKYLLYLKKSVSKTFSFINEKNIEFKKYIFLNYTFKYA